MGPGKLNMSSIPNFRGGKSRKVIWWKIHYFLELTKHGQPTNLALPVYRVLWYSTGKITHHPHF